MSASLAAFFLAALLAAAYVDALPMPVFILYLVASIATFAAYAMDKSAARNNAWRTKESTLHLFGLACGWPGALIAQSLLRHKSRKKTFQAALWMTVILNSGLLAAYLLHRPLSGVA